jgi:Ca-activated chloride channel family protein
MRQRISLRHYLLKFRPCQLCAKSIIVLLMMTYSAYAQVIPKLLQADTPASKSEKSRESVDSGGGFRLGVNVDLVLMYTSVFNKEGRFVTGLAQNNFRVFEDGVEQKIASFSQEDVPVSMGILMDLSGSMQGEKEQVHKAALAFIQASNPEDQVFLIGFNDEAELLQDFTGDIDEISDALDNAVVTGGTVLYDAIYLGVEKAHTGTKVKKAIVVITDGEDKDSYYKLDELIAKIQESDVQVFCVGFLEEIPKKNIFGSWSKSDSKRAYDALNQISEETGGKAFFPKQISEIHDIVSEIANELRIQYSIGYISTNTARDGSFRRVKIQLVDSKTPDTVMRYRRGYTAPKSGKNIPTTASETSGRPAGK